MIRYLSSFILTTFLYSICIGVFLYAFSNEKLTQAKKVPPKKISLNHIVLVKKEEPKVLKEEKIIPKVTEPIKEEPKVVEKKNLLKKKEVLKKVVEKKRVVKKKPKKIVKKVIKKKKIEKVVKKEAIKKKEIVKKVVIQEPIVPVKEVIVTKQKVVHVAPIVDYKEDFLRRNLLLIKKQIQKQVKYSKMAKRMNIQGNVVVEFVLSNDGSIREIKALSGHKLLRKSTIKAIHKASTYFPKVKKTITIKVPIEYKLI